MFARDGLRDTSTRVRAPVLAVTGEHDMEPMRQPGATQSLAPLCESLTVTPSAISGHYPMQEAPPLLATIVQHFLKWSAAVLGSSRARPAARGWRPRKALPLAPQPRGRG